MNGHPAKVRTDKIDVEERLHSDNSRCQCSFCILKAEYFYRCDWEEVAIKEFAVMLDTYLRYRNVRTRSVLGYMSPSSTART